MQSAGCTDGDIGIKSYRGRQFGDEMNGKKLWQMIESPQGFAFIDDSIINCDEKEVLRRVQCSLPYAEKVVSILRTASITLSKKKTNKKVNHA
jgi:hypothetical protein